ncbi:MAG TPA: hypothetical protein PK817_11490, partial [Dokdonella sp.]|nr:hypothetical protein [Dokdonella sp.]
ANNPPATANAKVITLATYADFILIPGRSTEWRITLMVIAARRSVHVPIDLSVGSRMITAR